MSGLIPDDGLPVGVTCPVALQRRTRSEVVLCFYLNNIEFDNGGESDRRRKQEYNVMTRQELINRTSQRSDPGAPPTLTANPPGLHRQPWYRVLFKLLHRAAAQRTSIYFSVTSSSCDSGGADSIPPSEWKIRTETEL